MRNIEKNYQQTDEIYQKNLIDDKESEERYQISEFNEEKMIKDIEILKLHIFLSTQIL